MRPYLHWCAERGRVVHAEAPRRAARPRDALRPRVASIVVVLTVVVGTVALPPGARGGAQEKEEEDNPQWEAGGDARGQHRLSRELRGVRETRGEDVMEWSGGPAGGGNYIIWPGAELM